jgi:hypothetical protein
LCVHRADLAGHLDLLREEEHERVERRERAADGVARDEQLRVRVVFHEQSDFVGDVVEGEAASAVVDEVVCESGRCRG